MQWLGVLLVAALVFGACRLIDKGFTKLFRSQAQHLSGLSVRLSKKYAAAGLILFVLGVSAIFTGIRSGVILAVCGGILAAAGICLVVYYMTFGVFYDGEGFLLTTFGRKTSGYRYQDIRCQQLYNAGGQIVIELYLTDDRTVQLQASMTGVYPFLDKAFEGWCRQRGIRAEDCAFHDPGNSCWFPPMED
ncbi:MAG: hypothetical protein PUB93_02775 [Firmicutes bacterium]|nr:hypothetical protein [Bacillota bacterium]